MTSRRLALLWLFAPSAALASPAVISLDHTQARAVGPDAPLTGSVCSHGEVRCFAHVQATPSGGVRAYAAPNGLGPLDLQQAYEIDPNITTTPVVAITDAYGYAALESDLAMYRSTYGLPPCTRANGCLRVVNQNGAATPLPADPPANDDWTIETALDADMVSAACPKCKIIVVQGTDSSFNSLAPAQNAAAMLGATVISNSFGAPTQPVAAGQTDDVLTLNAQYWNHPGIAQFVSTGDNGYNNVAGSGPTFPSISDHVISVGGTNLKRATNARGWTEVAWSNAGSSCAYSIPKPAFQTAVPCQFRATSDISAVADPATGVAVYNARNGGWIVVGGTSASSPLVAAMFASVGHGTATATEVAQSTSALYDITSGSNGACGNSLCNAGVGWDGPTGYGAPSAARIKNGGGTGQPIEITSPQDGATVDPGFEVDANIRIQAVAVELVIDGQIVDGANAAPYVFNAPATLAAGNHEVQVVAVDGTQQMTAAKIHVNVAPQQGGGSGSGSGGASSGPVTAGCSAGGEAGLVLVFGLGMLRRRRRS